MATHEIGSYSFGRIEVDGNTYTNDVILLPDGILDSWWREEGHALHTADLEAVLESRPDRLIVGQGAYGRMRVADDARQAVERAGIELVALRTSEAVSAYNSSSADQKTAAALHLTC